MAKHKATPWLQPKATQRKVAVGVGWYTESEWAVVKAAALDPERFEATYAEWVKMADEALANIRAAGITAEKQYVDAKQLLAWCLARGEKNDAAARAQFVSEIGRIKKPRP